MSFPFDPADDLIVVQAEIWGPMGSLLLSLALDTGATSTLISEAALRRMGYDPANALAQLDVAMGSHIAFAPRLVVDKIVALGRERTALPVLCHTLPPEVGVHGLLGLNFFRDQVLCIDFRKGEIDLD